jgi:protein-disulfide isomerase
MIAAGVIAVVLGVAAVAAVALTSGNESSNAVATKIEQSAHRLPEQDGFVLGSAQAPLALEVFEDFQCPFCLRFSAEAEPAIIEEYVATGKVRLVFRNFAILGNESEAAARGSVCAAQQGKAWDYGLALFSLQANANQLEVERLNVGRFSKNALIETADRVGLIRNVFATCLDGPESGATVREHYVRGQSLGVKGTPAFVLNGTAISRVPGDAAGWRTLLDEALKTTMQPQTSR